MVNRCCSCAALPVSATDSAVAVVLYTVRCLGDPDGVRPTPGVRSRVAIVCYWTGTLKTACPQRIEQPASGFHPFLVLTRPVVIHLALDAAQPQLHHEGQLPRSGSARRRRRCWRHF